MNTNVEKGVHFCTQSVVCAPFEETMAVILRVLESEALSLSVLLGLVAVITLQGPGQAQEDQLVRVWPYWELQSLTGKKHNQHLHKVSSADLS